MFSDLMLQIYTFFDTKPFFYNIFEMSSLKMEV